MYNQWNPTILCYTIDSMDVRKKFTLNMTMLIIIIVILSVLVFLSATRNPLQQEEGEVAPITTPETLFEDEDEIQEIDNTAAENNTTEPQTPPTEEEVLATITLKDNQTPEKQLRQPNLPIDANNGIAIYTIRLHASWSERLHPRWYPQGAHLSPMVAWSHRRKDTLFREGGTASEGMEIMAETGATNTLIQEIQSGIHTDAALTYATGTVFNAPGENITQITMERDTPHITVVSMIAPSPDWFITARNVQLYKDGEWVERVTIPAVLYDAGTDDGTEFTSKDSDTDPRESIMCHQSPSPRLSL